jgi:hypothetical protein
MSSWLLVGVLVWVLVVGNGAAFAPDARRVREKTKEALSAKWVIKRMARSLLEGLVLRNLRRLVDSLLKPLICKD